jgi:hypothetical protein
MLFSWIYNLYEYYTKTEDNLDFDPDREKTIRDSLEQGDYDKELVDAIVDLKKPKPSNK